MITNCVHWLVLYGQLLRERDRSGEADETRSGSAEGESPVPEGHSPNPLFSGDSPKDEVRQDVTWRKPTLHRKRDGWLFIGSDGRGCYLDPLWHQGARIAYALAIVKAWIAYRLFMIVGLGRINGLRWKLLPSVGDWAYRNNDGRLSSLAVFIDCDLRRRESAHPTLPEQLPEAGITIGEEG